MIILGLFLILSLDFVAAQTCLEQAETLCLADDNCHAIGLFNNMIQLHGCTTAQVPNHDWTIYARNDNNTFTQLPSGININEPGCSVHPRQEGYTCQVPKPYTTLGSYDVFTYENTIFYWNKTVYVVENIGCQYWEHVGIWEPSYGNRSYARIRELYSGKVVSNVSTSAGYGFVSAFPDPDKGTMWLFGVAANRCQGNGHNTEIFSWSSTDLVNWKFSQVMSYPSGTWNVQVTKVGPLFGSNPPMFAGHSPALPPHKYAMIIECFTFAINNNDDGDLTNGWTIIQSQGPPAPCGGPAMYYNPYDGYYYILTGGDKIHLWRTTDFQNWTLSKTDPLVEPTTADGLVAPVAGFPDASKWKGSPPMKYVGILEPYAKVPYNPAWTDNTNSWDGDSSDADVCCMAADVSNITYFLWGASRQGGRPSPPLTGSNACTNVLATAEGKPLWLMLSSLF